MAEGYREPLMPINKRGSSNSKRMSKVLAAQVLFRSMDDQTAKILAVLYTVCSKDPDTRDNNDIGSATTAFTDLRANNKIAAIRKGVLNREFFSRLTMHHIPSSLPIDKSSVVVFLFGEATKQKKDSDITKPLKPGDIISGKHLIADPNKPIEDSDVFELDIDETCEYRVISPIWIAKISQSDLKDVLTETDQFERVEAARFVVSVNPTMRYMRNSLADYLRIKSFPSKFIIITQNQRANNVYVVLDGFIEVIKHHSNATNRSLNYTGNATDFEDSIMIADNRLSTLPQISIIKILGKGSILNLGNLIRSKPSSFTCRVKGKPALLAVIESQIARDIKDIDPDLKEWMHLPMDSLDKASERLDDQLNIAYGDTSAQYQRLKLNAVIDGIDGHQGSSPLKVSDGMSNIVNENALGNMIEQLTENFEHKILGSYIDEVDMTADVSGWDGKKSMTVKNIEPVSLLSSMTGVKSDLNKLTQKITLKNKVVKAFQLNTDDLNLKERSSTVENSPNESKMSRVNFSLVKEMTNATGLTPNCSRCNEPSVIGKGYLERKSSAEKLNKWKLDVLLFKKKQSSRRALRSIPDTHSKSFDQRQVKAFEDSSIEVLRTHGNDTYKGRLGGKENMKKILDPNDPFRRLPELTTFIKRKEINRSLDPNNIPQNFKLSDQDDLLKIMWMSSQQTKKTLQKVNGAQQQAALGRFEKSCRQKLRILELTLAEQAKTNKIMARKFT